MARVDNLRDSTNRAVRVVALSHLADATAARERLSDSDDEALHDFRVALRRLRSWERAFRPYLRGDVSKKLRQRLREIAHDTGASRDLEVHIAWLLDQRRSLGRRLRPGLSWLVEQLERRKEEADAVLYEEVDSRFERLESRLTRAIGTYRERLHLKKDGRAVDPPMFAQALAPRLRNLAADLRKHLERVRSIEDERQGHQARIAAKRTRYLLEPVMRAVPGAVAIVDRLKALQDMLGDLHDAQVFGAEVASLAAEAGAESPPNAKSAPKAEPARPAPTPLRDPAESPAPAPPTPAAPNDDQPTPAEAATPVTAESPAAPPVANATVTAPIAVAVPVGVAASPSSTVYLANELTPGITAISARLHDRAIAAFAQFSNEWLGDRAAAFFRDLDDVADAIARAGREGLEIERKYLLSFVPEQARDGRRLDIAQGYIPGDRLNERLRRVAIHHASGRKEVHFYRTVKLGEGVVRTEVEEETTEAIFATMWPLTRRRRLRKRRFAVDVDGRTWEIDEFKNRNLVLAEIELESDEEDVPFPDWLAPAVQREVTGEPEFLNINLAR